MHLDTLASVTLILLVTIAVTRAARMRITAVFQIELERKPEVIGCRHPARKEKTSPMIA